MLRLPLCCCLVLLSALCAAEGKRTRTTTVERRQVNSSYRYATAWYNQTLDHFTFTTDLQFRQKYLVNDTWWNKEQASILELLHLFTYFLRYLLVYGTYLFTYRVLVYLHV
jgi:hypothetical protein